MEGVPLVDASGAAALQRLIRSAASRGTAIVLAGLAPEPAALLRAMKIAVPSAANIAEGLDIARRLFPAGGDLRHDPLHARPAQA